jgi:hypothetical protein
VSVVEAIETALEQRDVNESTRRVHDVVASELRRLSPGTTISTTGYFNHSFVPDLVLGWDDSGMRQERDVFLRFSVSTEAFGDDLRLLSPRDPLFLGLSGVVDQSAEQRWDTNGALVTSAPAVQNLASAVGAEERTLDATRSLVRRGRGVIDDQRATRITRQYQEALRSIDAMEGGEMAGDMAISLALSELSDWVPESAFVELEQGLFAEWIGAGGDPTQFPARSPWNPRDVSSDALRRVLLAMLNSRRSPNPDAWVSTASHVNAESLGRLVGAPFRGGRLNAMAASLLPYWTAQWALVMLQPSVPLENEFAWVIDGGFLGLDMGDIVVFFADDGRHFSSQASIEPLPTLSEIAPKLDSPDVLGASLRTREDEVAYRRFEARVRVGQRLLDILSQEGRSGYLVEAVSVEVPARHSTATVWFGRGLIDLNKRPTPVGVLAEMAFRFFTRRDPSHADSLKEFLSTRR